MIFDVSVAMTWLLFLALFPISFVWFRRAWRIFVRRDFSEVALKRGVAPDNPERWAPVVGILNALAASILVYVVVAVVSGWHPYDVWSAIAGATIWTKLILDFALARHAHFPSTRNRVGIRGGGA
jgi:ABC-type phosphate transport system permease subunit